jgi:Proline racemase
MSQLQRPALVRTVDYHTAGEPFRIVTGGTPSLPGSSVADRREHAAARLDHVRQLLVREPRGLDELDGFNLWYEARLTEEGVEDMQNLTTMNLVDVILHTRVPAGRLVDWIDQAFLLIHLEQADRDELSKLRGKEQCPAEANQAAESGSEARVKLRRVGIRTATDLLKAFSAERDQPCGALPKRSFALPADVKRLPLPEDQLRLLVAVLGSEPGLVPVWNWQRNGVPVGRS